MKAYFKFILGLYWLALIVCGACRILLKLNFMDVATGFYKGGDFIVLIFNILLAAVPIILFASNRLEKTDDDYSVYTRGRAVNLLAILTGLTIIAFAVIGAPESYLQQGHSVLFYQIRDYVNIFLGVLSGLAFVYLGVSGVFGRNKPPFSLVVVIPAIWQLVLLITRYNSYTTVVSISDHLLLVLFMICASLFLMGQARTLCGHMRKDGRNYTIPAGLSVSLFGFMLTVPNYVYMLVNNSKMPTALLGMLESAYILALSIYTLVFVTGLVRSIKKV